MVASEIHVPGDLGVLLGLMKRHPGALVYSGGTGILRNQGGRTVEFPPVVLCTYAIAELRRMSLTERFLELGAGSTFAEIEEYSPGSMHGIILDTIRGIGTVPLRNLATIGGNLACRDRFMDMWPVLACLDAMVELRNAAGVKWMNVNRLADESGRPAAPPGALFTRVRIPLERWDRALVVKVGNTGYPSADTAVFAFCARITKGVVDDFHLVTAGERAFRNREIESDITGRRVPFDAAQRYLLAEEYERSGAAFLGGGIPSFAALVQTAFEIMAN